MKHAADTLGLHGTYTDPLWQLTVHLTTLERDLLRCWWPTSTPTRVATSASMNG
ncbi:hypothetical protein [Kineococcus sp. SYSU DK003]|uniref:hypothetical protein n=1 Tax=Kineococcus sp. SYSU DK003 TaxID=3383124 RepID=UPI003D7DAD14